jgi:hypothetical protein
VTIWCGIQFEARLGGISKKDHGDVLLLYLKVTKLMVGCDDHILPMNMSLKTENGIGTSRFYEKILTPHLHLLV